MSAELAVELLKAMIFQAVQLATPILLAAMLIGLGISLFQAVTSIHEQTLTFVPKTIGILSILIVLMPWMLRSLVEFAAAMIQKMPQMAR